MADNDPNYKAGGYGCGNRLRAQRMSMRNRAIVLHETNLIENNHFIPLNKDKVIQLRKNITCNNWL